MAKKLLNGCSYTDTWVHPKNWKTSKNLKEDWRVELKFYDPLYKEKYPKGFLFRRRFNKVKDINERRKEINILLKEIPITFEIEGFNPITGSYMSKPYVVKKELHGDLFVIPALRGALDKLSSSARHKKDILYFINRFEKSVKKLHYSQVTINSFKRAYIKEVLMDMMLSDSVFNKSRAYLSSLYSELVEWECVDTNIVRDIRKRKEIKKIREIFKLSQLQQIFEYLKENYPAFYRYGMIFFHSGARSSELLRLQAKNVFIEKQEYLLTVIKGSRPTEVIKIILPNVIKLWDKLLNECNSNNDYLFGKGLKPNLTPIQPYQITKRFKRLVKDKMAFHNGELNSIKELEEKGIKDYIRITADFYSLKHLFLDELDRVTQNTELNLSSKLASHTTPAITNSVYLVNKKDRENETLKKINLSII